MVTVSALMIIAVVVHAMLVDVSLCIVAVASYLMNAAMSPEYTQVYHAMNNSISSETLRWLPPFHGKLSPRPRESFSWER